MAKLPTAPAAVFARARTVTYEAGAAIDEYDALAINDGVVEPAGDTDTAVAIAAGSAEAGENVTIAVDGAVPANVAGTVSAGDTLGSTATAGQLDAGDGNFTALTDAGDAAGLSHGGGLDDNVAMINIH